MLIPYGDILVNLDHVRRVRYWPATAACAHLLRLEMSDGEGHDLRGNEAVRTRESLLRHAAIGPGPAPAARVIRVPAIGQRVVCDGGREGVVHGISLRSPCCDDGVALSVRTDDFGIRSDWSRVHVRAAGPDPRFVEITVRDVSPSPADGPEPDGGADRVDVAGPADAHYRKAGGPIR